MTQSSKDLFSLEGKNALVTGAGSGIGEAIATLFAESGACVHIVDINADNAARVAQAIGDGGGKAESHTLDVSDPAACLAFAEKLPVLDILVNNAGIGAVGALLDTDAETMDRLYSVNVRGAFNMCKAFMPSMIERGSGSVVNMASIAGVIAVKDRLAYTMTKFAVVGLTKALALDHSVSGVRVNAICPARVETPWIQQRLKEYPDPEAAYREMSATQLAGRMVRPEEVAAAALYLASDAAVMVTGACHMIDSGWSAGRINIVRN